MKLFPDLQSKIVRLIQKFFTLIFFQYKFYVCISTTDEIYLGFICAYIYLFLIIKFYFIFS